MNYISTIPPEIEEYTFSELSPEAQQHAIEKWCETAGEHMDYEWWDCTYDSFKAVATMMGYDISNMYFSGFWCQGDGACFEGGWSPPVNPYEMLCKVLDEYPKWEEIHEIALTLAECADALEDMWVSCTLTHSGRYCHENTVSIDVSIDFPEDYDDWDIAKQSAHRAIWMARGLPDPDDPLDTCGWSDVLHETSKSLMRILYRMLEEDYEYQTGEEEARYRLSDGDDLFDAEGDMV